MSVRDVAAALGITPRRVQQLVTQGELKANLVGVRVLLIDQASVQAYLYDRRPAGRPNGDQSPLARFIAEALPTIDADPGPLDCWAWKVLRKDPPQLAALSAAIEVVDSHGQLGPLKRRVQQEHTSRRAHRPEDDDRLLDCLTEACAFAWAATLGLGTPQFDYRPGKPDIYVPSDLWVEAKSVYPSEVSREQMAAMRTGEAIFGTVAPPEHNRRLAFWSHLVDAKKKFARVGSGRRVIFFNLPSLDVAHWADKDAVLERYARWFGQLEAVDPTVPIVFCHAYDWQTPVRDTVSGNGQRRV